MQASIVAGIYTDQDSEIRVAYPVNYTVIPSENGVSKSYLKPHDGVVELSTGLSGASVGGINWNGKAYYVLGSNLSYVDKNGLESVVGSVGPGLGRATLDYSFDYLSVTFGGNLWLYNGTTLAQVTDPDVGNAITHIWVDGYFMFTDGEFIAVTELDDPFSVNPLKYGSSELDPDPVKSLIKIRNEPYAINRYTCEAFSNVGGSGFPFQVIDGAQIQKGAVGTHACCRYLDAIAMLGGSRNESLSIWVAAGGSTKRIATREIDKIISSYTEADLLSSVLEVRTDQGSEFLYVHLPKETLVYDNAATQLVGSPVWSVLTAGLLENSKYFAVDFVYCYDKWLCGHKSTGKIGCLDGSVSTQWGEKCRWEFSTKMAYNEGFNAIVHEVELVPVTGRQALGAEPTIWTSYSKDGATWSNEKPFTMGTIGDRSKRPVWLRQGNIKNWRIQKFRGNSDGHASFMRLNMRLEGFDG